MNKQIMIDAAKCTGCGLCQMVCSLSKSHRFNPSLARIKIWREETRGVFIPLTCQQCVNPPCANACLMNVISIDPITGVTVRKTDNCIGCRACQIACPFEACNYDHLLNVAVNCDQCGGNPACVNICPFGALQYLPVNEALNTCRDAEAVRRANL